MKKREVFFILYIDIVIINVYYAFVNYFANLDFLDVQMVNFYIGPRDVYFNVYIWWINSSTMRNDGLVNEQNVFVEIETYLFELDIKSS